MRQRFALALLSGLLTLLCACGPGTGGTGTGPPPGLVAQAGAEPAPVCSAAFAGLLACPANNGSHAFNEGTAAVQFLSAGTQPAYVITFSGNRVSLEGGCPRQSFEGEWGRLLAPNTGPEAPSLFFGSLSDARMIDPLASRMHIEAQGLSADGTPTLQLSLRDAQGQLVLGPLLLQRSAGTGTRARSCA